MAIRIRLLLLTVAPAAAWAATYEVGPGMPYGSIGAVPIESLGAGADTELLAQDGDLRWGWNWIKPGWSESFAGATGTITDLGGRIEGASPGFVDEGGQDYRLADGSGARGAAGALAGGVPAVDRQYVLHQGTAVRPGAADLGAFEQSAGGGGGPDGGVPGVDAGTPGPAPVDARPGAEEDPSSGVTGGCATAGGGAPWSALIIALLARRRRSTRAPRRPPGGPDRPAGAHPPPGQWTGRSPR